LAAKRQQVLVFEHVVLSRLGAEKDRVAKRLAADLATGKLGEDFLNGVAIVEKVVVRAEVAWDAGLLRDGFDLVAQPRGALVTERELIVGRDGTIGTMEFAAMRRHQGDDPRIAMQLGQRHRPSRQRSPAVWRLDQAQS